MGTGTGREEMGATASWRCGASGDGEGDASTSETPSVPSDAAGTSVFEMEDEGTEKEERGRGTETSSDGRVTTREGPVNTINAAAATHIHAAATNRMSRDGFRLGDRSEMACSIL